MDASTQDPDDGLAGAGPGRTPRLALDGFSGPLARLLILARARQVDLGRLSLAALLDQLAAALQQASPTTPLGEKGDWVVMAAWLVQLRSLLLLPAAAPARKTAEAAADQLRDRLASLQAMQVLATWLDARPQLGRDGFARGQPEGLGVSSEAAPALDVIEFLWANLALFDDVLPGAETIPQYRPRWHDLHSVPEARARILRRLAEAPDGCRLDTLLPEAADATGLATAACLRRRSAWSSTLVASLELAKQGEVGLGQGGDFSPIHVRAVCTNQLQSTSNRDSRAC